MVENIDTVWLRCARCGSALPEESFYRRSDRTTGRQSWCITCVREYDGDPEVKMRAQERADLRGFRRVAEMIAAGSADYEAMLAELEAAE